MTSRWGELDIPRPSGPSRGAPCSCWRQRPGSLCFGEVRFKSQGGHEAEKVSQWLSDLHRPHPVTPGPARLWPHLQAPVRAGSLADQGRSPHSLSSRQSHPGPLRGLWKDQQTAPSGGNFSGSPSPDRQSWDREALQTGPPRRTSRRLCVGAVQTPPATGRPGDTDGVCAKWGRARWLPTRQWLLDPPGPQGVGSQEAGDPAPPRMGTLVGPYPAEFGSSPKGRGAYLAWGRELGWLPVRAGLSVWILGEQEDLMCIRACGPDTPLGAFPTVSSRRLLSTNDMLGPALSSTLGMEKLRSGEPLWWGQRETRSLA